VSSLSAAGAGEPDDELVRLPREAFDEMLGDLITHRSQEVRRLRRASAIGSATG
jgi:hypothetical protein